MKKLTTALFACLFAIASYAASPDNPAPLGLKIGSATMAEVKSLVEKQGRLENLGKNQAAGGSVLRGKGNGLGIDGLREISFTFDANDVLAAVTMSLDKGEGFEKTMNRLASKYKLTSKNVPFVGDAEARFAAGDSVIILESPHMSFSMTLVYAAQDVMAAANAHANNARVQKETEQASKL
jgi:hypothetical protein